MRWFVLGGFLLLVVSCAGPRPVLHVKQFHLRDVSVSEGAEEAEVVKSEKLKLLYGAVTAEERRGRLGDYYSVSWAGPEGAESEEVRLVFDYRQAATGSQVHTMEEGFPPGRVGTGEFKLNGEDFAERGRVLAWRVRLYRGASLVATKRSYLWN